MLESADQSQTVGRFSFMGYNPTKEISCTDGTLTIKSVSEENGTEVVEVKNVAHPGDEIRKILNQYKSPVIDKMPTFTGGLVGYFSYDYIKYAEPKLKLEDKEGRDFKDLDLMLFDEVIAFDHYRQKLIIIAGVMLEDKNETDAAYNTAVQMIKSIACLLK